METDSGQGSRLARRAIRPARCLQVSFMPTMPPQHTLRPAGHTLPSVLSRHSSQRRTWIGSPQQPGSADSRHQDMMTTKSRLAPPSRAKRRLKQTQQPDLQHHAFTVQRKSGRLQSWRVPCPDPALHDPIWPVPTRSGLPHADRAAPLAAGSGARSRPPCFPRFSILPCICFA